MPSSGFERRRPVGGSGGGAAVAPPQNTMKASAWRAMNGEELEQKVRELTEELFNLRFQLSMGVAKNPSRVQHAKRDLARAKTILRERAGS